VSRVRFFTVELFAYTLNRSFQELVITSLELSLQYQVIVTQFLDNVAVVGILKDHVSTITVEYHASIAF